MAPSIFTTESQAELMVGTPPALMAPTYDLVSSARTEINELTLITTTKIARKKKKRQTWPGDVVAIKLLDGDGVVDDLGEHLHLLQIFGAEVTLLGGLQILQQLLVVDRALEGVAGPLAKGLLNGLADGVLAHNVLLVSFGRHQSLLQVLLSADFLATHNQLQGEIPHKPHELGEVEGQLAKILSERIISFFACCERKKVCTNPLVITALGANVLGQFDDERRNTQELRRKP